MAVSLIIFMGFLLGGGMIPAAIGYWAEAFSFSSGFTLLGLLFLALLPVFQRSIRETNPPPKKCLTLQGRSQGTIG